MQGSVLNKTRCPPHSTFYHFYPGQGEASELLQEVNLEGCPPPPSLLALSLSWKSSEASPYHASRAHVVIRAVHGGYGDPLGSKPASVSELPPSPTSRILRGYFWGSQLSPWKSY